MKQTKWTPKLIAERLEDAAYSLRRMPPVKVRGYFNVWPQVVQDYWGAYGAQEPRIRLGPPTGKAIDEMDEALGWLLLVEADASKLLWARATNLPWKAISYRFGMDRTTAWRHWMFALVQISSHLNSKKAQKNFGQQQHKCCNKIVRDKRNRI